MNPVSESMPQRFLFRCRPSLLLLTIVLLEAASGIASGASGQSAGPFLSPPADLHGIANRSSVGDSQPWIPQVDGAGWAVVAPPRSSDLTAVFPAWEAERALSPQRWRAVGFIVGAATGIGVMLADGDPDPGWTVLVSASFGLIGYGIADLLMTP